MTFRNDAIGPALWSRPVFSDLSSVRTTSHVNQYFCGVIGCPVSVARACEEGPGRGGVDTHFPEERAVFELKCEV